MKGLNRSKTIKSWDELPMNVSRELDLIYSRSINQIRVDSDILYVGFNTKAEGKMFQNKHGGRLIGSKGSSVTRIPYFVELTGWLELV